MITLSIDVTKLDKARFKRITRKSGEEAVFCDLVLIPTPEGKYGDYMVKQSITKEEREGGKQLPILGNGKKVIRGERKPSVDTSAATAHDTDDDQSVPF